LGAYNQLYMPDLSQNIDLDLTLLNEIADGSDEFVIESITMFIEQTPSSLQDISNAIAARDWENAGAYAHKIKSTLGFFGMLNSQTLIQQIETDCRGGSPDVNEVIANFNQVQTLIAVSTNALITIKQELQAGL
jgi:HPt (histidine-containing phosphotransfer) domain-containing protein